MLPGTPRTRRNPTISPPGRDPGRCPLRRRGVCLRDNLPNGCIRQHFGIRRHPGSHTVVLAPSL